MPAVERPAMSDYGVPSDPEGALPWSWAEERLVANRNYWVVTASVEGSTFVDAGVGSVAAARPTASGSRARRTRARRATSPPNPQCAVTVDDTVECVSVEGHARLVDPTGEPAAVDEVVAAYIGKYWDDPAVHAEMEAFLRGHALLRGDAPCRVRHHRTRRRIRPTRHPLALLTRDSTPRLRRDFGAYRSLGNPDANVDWTRSVSRSTGGGGRRSPG